MPRLLLLAGVLFRLLIEQVDLVILGSSLLMTARLALLRSLVLPKVKFSLYIRYLLPHFVKDFCLRAPSCLLFPCVSELHLALLVRLASSRRLPPVHKSAEYVLALWMVREHDVLAFVDALLQHLAFSLSFLL